MMGKAALRLESRRKRVAGLHPGGHIVQLRGKMRVLLVLGSISMEPRIGSPRESA